MAPTKQGRKGHVSGDQNVKIEVSQYLLEPSERRNPLQYWKENEYKFPILAKLAKIYLIVPATSVAVERFFGIVGKILRPDRLNDSTFQK